MNSSKIEFILFCYPAQLKKCSSNCIKVNSAAVDLSVSIKYLGVYLDNNLCVKKHISHKCRLAMQNVHRIRNIRSTLTSDAAHTLVLGLVMSHLNFWNSVLFGLRQKLVHKMQRVQNIAGKLVLNKQKYDSAAESRKLLHWLLIAPRFEFKIFLLVYNAFKLMPLNTYRICSQKKPVLKVGLRSSKH